jgi:type I restriction enzyme M protein
MVLVTQGVKANVLLCDRKPAWTTPWTKKLWIYDLRTNQHFTLKQNLQLGYAVIAFSSLLQPAEIVLKSTG